MHVDCHLVLRLFVKVCLAFLEMLSQYEIFFAFSTNANRNNLCFCSGMLMFKKKKAPLKLIVRVTYVNH